MLGGATVLLLGSIAASAAEFTRLHEFTAGVSFLLVQGAALIIGRGDCPFGPFQRRLGDPVPMFELVLPPRAAKAAIPVLLVVTITGLAALATRPPRPARDTRR